MFALEYVTQNFKVMKKFVKIKCSYLIFSFNISGAYCLS